MQMQEAFRWLEPATVVGKPTDAEMRRLRLLSTFDAPTHQATVRRCWVGGHHRSIASCTCGWKSEPRWTQEQAQTVADQHNRRTA